MKQTIAILVAALLVGVATGTVTRPARSSANAGHKNLTAAQQLTKQAFDKVTAAQKANEFDLGGHAAMAKSLLEQAAAELKLATEQQAAEQGK